MVSVILYCPHLGRDFRGIVGNVPDPRIMTGYPTPQGHDGCLEMHHAAVRMAMYNGWERVFVMEDDCEFTRHFSMAKWDADAEWAQARGYDVLVGGCVQTYGPRNVREGLVEVDKFHSAHCVVYFKSGYEKILKTIQPYDTSLGDVGCKTVMAYPFVAVQRPSFSGILQRDVNYVPLYEQYEEHLGRALGLRA